MNKLLREAWKHAETWEDRAGIKLINAVMDIEQGTHESRVDAFKYCMYQAENHPSPEVRMMARMILRDHGGEA